ncbi:hypothetical protein [Pantoea stewartii]|uniref:hypothetical protein n=1 Tax=Pantoea stewartii TaxID=66269 RepID=UPI001390693F|nr:hypothetical protein [Pantoea stewartii]
MTKDEVLDMLLMVRQAYRDSLDGKSVSFTGVNGRSITNHDPAAIREELAHWEKRWRAFSRRGGPFKLAKFL